MKTMMFVRAEGKFGGVKTNSRLHNKMGEAVTRDRDATQSSGYSGRIWYDVLTGRQANNIRTFETAEPNRRYNTVASTSYQDMASTMCRNGLLQNRLLELVDSGYYRSQPTRSQIRVFIGPKLSARLPIHCVHCRQMSPTAL